MKSRQVPPPRLRQTYEIPLRAQGRSSGKRRGLTSNQKSEITYSMPLPIIAAALGALAGSAATKKKKKKAVSGYTTKKGTKVKAYLKKAKY